MSEMIDDSIVKKSDKPQSRLEYVFHFILFQIMGSGANWVFATALGKSYLQSTNDISFLSFNFIHSSRNSIPRRNST